jgi:hypothetical protein
MGLVPLAEPFEPIAPPRDRVAARPERRKPPTSLNFGRISALVLLGMVIVAAVFGLLLWRGVLR